MSEREIIYQQIRDIEKIIGPAVKWENIEKYSIRILKWFVDEMERKLPNWTPGMIHEINGIRLLWRETSLKQN